MKLRDDAETIKADVRAVARELKRFHYEMNTLRVRLEVDEPVDGDMPARPGTHALHDAKKRRIISNFID